MVDELLLERPVEVLGVRGTDLLWFVYGLSFDGDLQRTQHKVE